jgi:hypothetical protein
MVRRAGIEALNDPFDLLQLFHQSAGGMHAPGRIDDQCVDAARLGRNERVVHDGRRIGAMPLRDHVSLRASAPLLELFHGSGTKRVGCCQQYRVLRLAQQMRELADRRRLAGAVDAYYEHHRGTGRRESEWHFDRLQQLHDTAGEGGMQILAAPGAQHVEQRARGIDTDIGAEQSRFELLAPLWIETSRQQASQVTLQPATTAVQSLCEPRKKPAARQLGWFSLSHQQKRRWDGGVVTQRSDYTLRARLLN